MVKQIKENGSIAVLAADILSMMIVKPAGEMGFDVAVGSAQRFGVPMMNGGPHAGFMAVSEELKRKMPGRVVGISRDSNGNSALRLALQTREQHIKREKATSNICTAQALLANMATFFAMFYGKEGLTKLANRVSSFANVLTNELNKLGYSTVNKSSEIFDTVVVDCNKSGVCQKKLLNFFYENKINLRDFYNKNHIGVSFNDTNTTHDLNALVNLFAQFKSSKISNVTIDFSSVKAPSDVINQNLLRNDKFLNQDFFNKYT